MSSYPTPPRLGPNHPRTTYRPRLGSLCTFVNPFSFPLLRKHTPCGKQDTYLATLAIACFRFTLICGGGPFAFCATASTALRTHIRHTHTTGTLFLSAIPQPTSLHRCTPPTGLCWTALLVKSAKTVSHSIAALTYPDTAIGALHIQVRTRELPVATAHFRRGSPVEFHVELPTPASALDPDVTPSLLISAAYNRNLLNSCR